MGANPSKAFPTPGAIGTSLGSNAVSMAQLPGVVPLQATPASTAAQPLKPLSASQGTVLQPGQAAVPVAQTPSNPWGADRGGNGLLPLYRRPGTMPGLA